MSQAKRNEIVKIISLSASFTFPWQRERQYQDYKKDEISNPDTSSRHVPLAASFLPSRWIRNSEDHIHLIIFIILIYFITLLTEQSYMILIHSISCRNSQDYHPLHPFVSLPWGFGPRYREKTKVSYFDQVTMKNQTYHI